MPDPQASAGPSFEVRLDEDGDTVSLIFSGELDLATVGAAEQGFKRALQNGALRVMVDLTELTFVDSTGIALFVLAKRRDDSDRLRFQPSASSAVRRVLSVTGVDEALGLTDGRVDGSVG